MINQLEDLIKEIINNIDKEEIKVIIDFEKYKEYVFKYVKEVDKNLIENTYNIMIFETIYLNVLTIMIEETIKIKYNVKIKSNTILKKIDLERFFCRYKFKKVYINRIKEILSEYKKIDLKILTEFYEKSIDKQYKKILGQFYTPQVIVNEMLKDLEISDKIKILDPACGAGIFLTEIIDKYNENSKNCNIIEFVNNNLYANDINPFAIVMTKINILIKLISICRNSKEFFEFINSKNILKNIKLVDTLSIIENDINYDIILGNPPFFKMTKEQLKAYNINTFGQTNIYEMFIYWAIRNVKLDGSIKYIIPQSFKSGLYFKNLRQEISKYYITSIININNTSKIFCDVEQAVLIINIKKTESTNKNTEIKSYDAIKNVITQEIVIENEKIFNKENGSYEMNIATDKQEYMIIEKINKNRNIKSLSEFGYKFANGLFVWNQNKDIIVDKKARNIPIIYGDYIEKEKFNSNIILRNSKKEKILPKNRKIKKIRIVWKKLIIQRTSTFSQHNRLNAALIGDEFLKNNKYYLLENHINYLMIKDNKDKVIDERNLYFFWAIINSDLINWLFKLKSGNTQISATELNLLPICPYNEKIYTLSKEYSDTMEETVRERLQTQICISYGLNKKEIVIVRRRK